MPLYHTMGVRSLLAMSLIGGLFVCLPRFDIIGALRLIENEKITNLYLVPTLYHDLVHHEAFANTNVSSVRKLGFAGAPMTDGLLATLTKAFQPELFVNHYGSSEIYTFTINQDAAKKPGSAGRAGINQMIRIVKMGASDPDQIAAPGEEGEIAAIASGDEAFEGYWQRPEANAKAFRNGWYMTGDTGFMDEDGDIFVTGRVDDMIITGGENVSPVEIESCLSLHPAVSEVAVVGLPEERGARQLQATTAVHLRSRDPEISCRQAFAPEARRRRIQHRAGVPYCHLIPTTHQLKGCVHERHRVPSRSKIAGPGRLPRGGGPLARESGYHPEPPALQHHFDAAARSAATGFRDAR
jgi:2-furoate---CoA ligase